MKKHTPRKQKMEQFNILLTVKAIVKKTKKLSFSCMHTTLFNKHVYFFWFLDGKNEVYKVQFQKLNAVFVGTGDLFAACLLAWLEKDKDLKVLCNEEVILYEYIYILYALQQVYDLE